MKTKTNIPLISTDNTVSLHDTVFTVFDVETTGLSAESNRMTEIGIVKMRGGEIIDEYETLMNPGEFVPPYITQLTGCLLYTSRCV